MNTQLVVARSRIVQLIRQWFDGQGFTEMITPRMVGVPGQEPYLEPFWSEVMEPSSHVPRPASLVTSPEYAMKRLLAAGLDKIYDLGPCFRNHEPWDGMHDPEFLMLEWYRRDAGLEELMKDTEAMIKWVTEKFIDEARSPKPGVRHDELRASGSGLRSAPFRRLTVEDAWRQYAGVELAPLLGDREALAKVAVEKFNQTVTPDDDWDDIYFKVFLSAIEPHLGWEEPDFESRISNFERGVGERQDSKFEIRYSFCPTFLYRYPASQASLSRKCSDDPRWAERVELYVGDYELANGFAELCDADEQRKRFDEERALRAKLGKKTWPSDERFLADLPKMGNAAGIAFGVERLVMLLTGSESINDILPFPARERFVG